MQIKNRQNLLVILALVVVGLFAGDKLLLNPLTDIWNARSKRVADLRKQVEQGKSLLDREAAIHRQWARMQSNTLTNNPSAAEQQFFRALYNWEQQGRVVINGRTPQWKHDADEYMTLQCRVEASGDLSSLCRFLYAIEHDPMGLKLESVEVAARDKEARQLTLGLQLSGLVLIPQTR